MAKIKTPFQFPRQNDDRRPSILVLLGLILSLSILNSCAMWNNDKLPSKYADRETCEESTLSEHSRAKRFYTTQIIEEKFQLEAKEKAMKENCKRKEACEERSDYNFTIRKANRWMGNPRLAWKWAEIHSPELRDLATKALYCELAPGRRR